MQYQFGPTQNTKILEMVICPRVTTFRAAMVTLALLLGNFVSATKHRKWLPANTFVNNDDFPMGTLCMLATLDERVYLFSSSNNDGTLGNHFHKWDPFERKWTDIFHLSSGSIPSSRSGAGFSGLYHRLYLFGGQSISDGTLSNQMFEWDSATFVWSSVPPSSAINHVPEARCFAGFASSLERIYLHGGSGLLGLLGDLHEFDPINYTWTDLSNLPGAPPARTLHGFAFMSGMLYVFSGWTNSPGSRASAYNSGNSYVLRDFYRFDTFNRVWKDLSSTGLPDARKSFGFASVNNILFLCGGSRGFYTGTL